MGNEQAKVGLCGEYKDGKLVRAVYYCAECHQPIYNHEKAGMVARGHWEPTAISQNPYYRSRRLSAFVSPFVSWTEVLRKYNQSLGDPEQERSFANLFLGIAYRESGERPKMQSVISLRSDYQEGVVQPGMSYICGGIDVQRGSEIDPTTGNPRDPDNPPRLEAEFCAFGRGYRSASVIYLRFEGPIDNAWEGAWKKLAEWAVHGGRDGGPGTTFYRADGRPFYVDQILIDSGDGMFTSVVYEFCRLSAGGTNPSKGFQFVKDDRKRAERGDPAGPQFFRKWKPVRLDSGQILYTISTNFYKTALYNNLRVQSTLENPNPPGLCRFPFSYSDEYFAMLTGEEKRSDGSFHPIRRRVESLDCRCLCMASSDIFLDRVVMDYRMQAQRAGASPETIQSIDGAFVIGRLEEQAGIVAVGQRGAVK